MRRKQLLGRDLFWFFDKTGLIRASKESQLGDRMAGRETLVDSSPRKLRRRHGVQLHGRAVDAGDATVRFADGGALEVGRVIWATGFRTDHAWIDVPVPDNRGRPVHQRGVTGWPGRASSG